MNKAVNVRHPSRNSRAKTLWKVRKALEKERDAYYDQTSEQQIVSQGAVRQELRDKLLLIPTLALDVWAYAESWRASRS